MSTNLPGGPGDGGDHPDHVSHLLSDFRRRFSLGALLVNGDGLIPPEVLSKFTGVIDGFILKPLLEELGTTITDLNFDDETIRMILNGALSKPHELPFVNGPISISHKNLMEKLINISFYYNLFRVLINRLNGDILGRVNVNSIHSDSLRESLSKDFIFKLQAVIDFFRDELDDDQFDIFSTNLKTLLGVGIPIELWNGKIQPKCLQVDGFDQLLPFERERGMDLAREELNRVLEGLGESPVILPPAEELLEIVRVLRSRKEAATRLLQEAAGTEGDYESLQAGYEALLARRIALEEALKAQMAELDDNAARIAELEEQNQTLQEKNDALTRLLAKIRDLLKSSPFRIKGKLAEIFGE